MSDTTQEPWEPGELLAPPEWMYYDGEFYGPGGEVMYPYQLLPRLNALEASKRDLLAAVRMCLGYVDEAGRKMELDPGGKPFDMGGGARMVAEQARAAVAAAEAQG